jgi:hypothetical protein
MPNFFINSSAAVAHVDSRFLSVTMDGHAFDGGADMPFWKPASPLTRLLASALAPAHIRFGGNSHSTLLYNMTGAPLPSLPPLPAPAYQPPSPRSVMSREQWVAINDFCAAVGWTNVFALNALLRVDDGKGGTSSRWDGDIHTSAAAGLLNFTFEHQGQMGSWSDVVWEISNEPDLLHYSYNISDHAGAFCLRTPPVGT